MSSIVSSLAALLGGVERPGDFYTAGTAEIFSPRLEVDGVGPVALPLLQVQAEALIAAAERAPYGRGEDTVYDEKVRRTWQIEATRVRISGRHWEQGLNAMVAQAAEGLGVPEPVQVEFYKLLVYGEGDFFVSHRDTEKAAGMFGTLVIVLPSIYTGGELVVRHGGREAKLDMRREDPCEAAFAAFYADCLHEVLPIASGCRLTLIYNLLRKGGPLPEPPDYRAEQDRVSGLLRQWAEAAGTPVGGLPKNCLSAPTCIHTRGAFVRGAERCRCRHCLGAEGCRTFRRLRTASRAALDRGKRFGGTYGLLWIALEPPRR